MKKCTSCKHEKSETNFYDQRQRGHINGQVWMYKDSLCKPCRNRYTTDRRRRIKVEAIAYLGGACERCKVVDLQEIYDFHHADPSKKDFAFGKVGRSFELIKNELDKCILLCANCHRKEHAQR